MSNSEDSTAGLGIRISPVIVLKKIWVGLGFELILWSEIPAILSFEFFGWNKRSFQSVDNEVSALTILRIQFLLLDIELYITGGSVAE